jgi:hypothetical protein
MIQPSAQLPQPREVVAALVDPERRRQLARIAEQGPDPTDRGSALALLASCTGEHPDLSQFVLDRIQRENDTGVIWMITAVLITRPGAREAVRTALIERVACERHQPTRRVALQILCSYFGTDPNTRSELLRLAVDDADQWARGTAVNTLAFTSEESRSAEMP